MFGGRFLMRGRAVDWRLIVDDILRDFLEILLSMVTIYFPEQ